MRYPIAAVAVAFVVTCWTARVCQGQATDAAHQRVTTAQKTLAKAEADLKAAKDKVDSAVQSTPEYSEAAKAKADAQAKYDAVLKAAAQSLQNSPAYKSAVEKKHEAELKRNAVKSDANATPEQRTEAATELLAASSAVTKLERDAGTADPAVAEAKTALAAANAKLAALRQDMEAKYKDDKDVQAASKVVEDDKTALEQAKKGLGTQQQSAAQNSSGGSGGGGGGHGGGGGGGGRKH